MWVITTRVRARGSVPASMSLWPGLPPQSTSTASPPATKRMEVASRSRPGRAPELPRKTKCTASGGGADPAQKQRDAHEGEGHADDAGQLGHANGPEHERVGAESLGDETAGGVEPEVGQEERARRPLDPVAEDADQDDEDQEVPHRLVEEGRVEELFLGELGWPMLRRDVESPRQVRGRAEGLFVEEVAPPAYGLAQCQARRRDVQIGDGRQAAPQRVAAAEEETAQHAAVDGEPALPHGEDLGRKASVVVQVEGDVVEARADQAAEEAQLAGLEQVVGIDAAPPGLTVSQPEAKRHGARHQDPVPANRQAVTEKRHWTESDCSWGMEHTAFLIRPTRSGVK